MNKKLFAFPSKFQCYILLISCFIFSCGDKEEAIRIAAINLTNETLYEKLPANTTVASLSTDIADNTITFRLVEGEGDTNNADFEIKGTILKTRKILQFADGNSRSIRIQAKDGMNTYDEVINIAINEFAGTYPSISSPSFENNQLMPRGFGADFGNVSPDLNITDIPESTVSMLLTMNDLDDGNGYHWAVWNISSTKMKIIKNESWTNGVIVGDNNYGTGYVGPFPPNTHRYEITVYFLNTNLTLEAKDYFSLATTIPGKVIAQTSMIGKYKP